ncbi:hypothetical protein Lsan_2268 [Legionella santicrucis]|uniref:Transmembrane protein n=2 Tax=Legionella santicrucis TaxID=45074 RepID=A0A0W0YRB1_9GAMM|nr:hypothetical protein Lsan_2268 [Legionella santicrucis]
MLGMKKYFIFIVLFVVAFPYTNNNEITSPETVAASGYTIQCSQKAPTSTIRCNLSQNYVIPTLLNLSKTLSLLSLLSFTLCLLILCTGFKTRIYKPPRRSPIVKTQF